MFITVNRLDTIASLIDWLWHMEKLVIKGMTGLPGASHKYTGLFCIFNWGM